MADPSWRRAVSLCGSGWVTLATVVVLETGDVVLAGVAPCCTSMITSSSVCSLVIRCVALMGTCTVSAAAGAGYDAQHRTVQRDGEHRPVVALALAERAGLQELTEEHLPVPTDKGTNAGLKVCSLVAGMVAERTRSTTWRCCGTAGWAGCSPATYAPSTLGSFLRAFTFGHIRQLDAVASRFLLGLTRLTGMLATTTVALRTEDDPGQHALVDVDDTVVEVHGHAKRAPGSATTGSVA